MSHFERKLAEQLGKHFQRAASQTALDHHPHTVFVIHTVNGSLEGTEEDQRKVRIFFVKRIDIVIDVSAVFLTGEFK